MTFRKHAKTTALAAAVAVLLAAMPALADEVKLKGLITNAGVRNEAVMGHIAGTGLSENAFLMFFFAAFAFLAAAAFALYARGYPMQDNYRAA
jgi:POT family proton-dependent oligopeptide transporter